jgi:PIN domain-containing protein
MNADTVLFIDANQYLLLYRIVEGKKLLDPLEEQKDRIFVTAQIADEVNRNKLHLARAFLFEQFKKLELTQIGLPDHLFGISDEKTADLRKSLHALGEQARKVKAELVQLALSTLHQVSKSEDEVSRRLKVLFDGATAPSEKELQSAKERKEKGNPPGKPGDPLGDQLNWEQLLTRCKEAKGLWIVTEDKDYCTEYEKSVLLNPLLYRELIQSRPTEIYCFNNLLDGITHFAKNAGVTAEKLPTEDEAEKIKKEIDSLPPFSWQSSSIDQAANVAIQNAHLLRRQAAALIAAAGQDLMNRWGDEFKGELK